MDMADTGVAVFGQLVGVLIFALFFLRTLRWILQWFGLGI